MLTAWYARLNQKALQRLKPVFTNVHIDGFYEIQHMKNDAINIQDKKVDVAFKMLRIKMRVKKFVDILKERTEQRKRRRCTLGLTADQQAKFAIEKSNKLVKNC